jgi:hypothetical protein
MPESTDDVLHPLTCCKHLTSRILFTIATFPLYSLTVLYWDDPHAGDCGISAQLLAVDLVKQDVGTFFSCTVHASPATRLIDPFTHISKEFTLFGKWHWWRVDHIGPILGNMGPTQGCAHCIDITAVDAKHPSLHEGRVITEG